METHNISVEILKALADKTRLSIIAALQSGPMTAGDIEKAINKSQSSTSQQLKKLVETNILTFKQDGTCKFFKPKDPQIFDLIHSIQAFVSIAESKMIYEQNEEKKILLMGLDDSGKTSILLSLTGNKNLMSYSSYEPTKGYRHMKEIITNQGVPIETEVDDIYFEAGGQIVYRNEYINDPEKYLSGFDKIIYTIDVQSDSRYDESIEYLAGILEKLTEMDEPTNIAVFLHKFDPSIDILEKYSDSRINSLIINKIKSVMPPQFDFEIFKTSIFTVFRKNLLLQSFRA